MTVRTRVAVAPPGVAAVDGGAWLASLERLFAIPEPYRSEVVDRHGALEMLRCGEQVLDELVARGLPCSGGRGEERFDRNDLFNLALYSGSGQSLPEIGFQFALRWMTAPTATLFERKRWTVSVALDCGRRSCGADADWALARPLPEHMGGSMLSLELSPGEASDDGVLLRSRGARGLALDCVVETRGEHLELRSRGLCALVRELMGAGHRWCKLPEELQRRPELLLPNGVATCISASLHLERACREAGYEARTRRGWMLGMLDIAHAWLEVVDEDGQVKVVDPIFALLSSHVPDANPEFMDVCMGSRLNRLLATERRADEPLAWHRCAGADAPLRKRTSIKPLAERRNARARAHTRDR